MEELSSAIYLLTHSGLDSQIDISEFARYTESGDCCRKSVDCVSGYLLYSISGPSLIQNWIAGAEAGAGRGRRERGHQGGQGPAHRGSSHLS